MAGYFGRYFVRYFARYFVRDFVRDFVREFVREFVHYFGRDFGHYFGRDFGRYFTGDFLCDFIHYFVRDFGRDFGRDFVRDFGRDFGRDLGVNLEAADAEGQLEQALQDEAKVQWLWAQSRFWWWLSFYRGIELAIDPAQALTRPQPKLQVPWALHLLFGDMLNAAAYHQLLCLGRHFSTLFPEGGMPAQDIDRWLQRHPVRVHGSAWSWQEQAQLIAKHHGKLSGPLGALAMAHADYAFLMTGVKLDSEGSPWKHLLDTRDPSCDAPIALETSPLPLSLPKQESTMPSSPCLFTWLHLSDIHIGYPDAEHRNRQALILKSLRDDLAGSRQRFQLPRIDAILITGDIAWSGKAEHYQEAQQRIEEIARLIEVPSFRVFMVPGNHDVDRDVDKERDIKRLVRDLRESPEKESLDGVLADATDRQRLRKRQAAYLEFASKWAKVEAPGGTLFADGLYWTYMLEGQEGLRIRLLGLNSALLAADNEDQGKLRLGQEPWAKTLSAGGGEEGDELIVVLTHHPFMDKWLGDEKDAQYEARSRAHLHLCGHVHEPDSAGYFGGGGTGNVVVVAGAVQGDKGGAPEHGYSLGAIVRSEDGPGYCARVYPRRWSDKNREFRLDIHNVPRGGGLFAEHSIPRLGKKGKR